MRLIEYGEARRILILYIIISTIITKSESRNIQEQNELHPPAVNAVTNLMGELKDKLNNLLSSVRQDSINDDRGTQERSSNVYESTRNFPNEDFSQYRHLATPHPTLQDDGLLYDYDDNSIDNHETGKVHHDSNKKEVGTTDEISIDGNAGESEGKNGKKEDSNNEVWIPDCDIPPYPDMLQRKGINFPEEDDEVREDSDKTDDADVGRRTVNDALMNDDDDDPVFDQKLEDGVIEELLDGSSGDMTSRNMGKTEVSSNVNDIEGTVLINAEDDFIKKLKDLKNSLGRMLSDEAPPESNLVNIMREMSEVLEKRFGEVERLHEKVRVRDLIGREKVKKIQDYHRKTTSGAADDKDNALLEVKKARKRLKLITKNNEEELLPDYIGVMQELISMLRTTKRVVRGIKDEAINEEKILGSNDPKSGNVYSTNPNSRDQIEMENFVNSQLKDRESGYGKQDLKKKMKNLKRSSKWMDIDRLDSDSIEDLMEKKENFEDKLRNNLKKQSRSRDDRRGLGGSEIDSFEDEETWMTKKQKKKKEKEKKKWKGSFGRKVVEDL